MNAPHTPAFAENSLDTRLGQTWLIANGLATDIRTSPHPASMFDALRPHTDLLRAAVAELTEGCAGMLGAEAKAGPSFIHEKLENIDGLFEDTEKTRVLRIFSILRETRDIASALLVMRQSVPAEALSREMQPVGFLTREETEKGWSAIYDRIYPHDRMKEAYEASADALFFNVASGLIYPDIAYRCRRIIIDKHADMQGRMNHYMGSAEWSAMHDNFQRLVDLDPFKLAKVWQSQTKAA